MSYGLRPAICTFQTCVRYAETLRYNARISSFPCLHRYQRKGIQPHLRYGLGDLLHAICRPGVLLGAWLLVEVDMENRLRSFVSVYPNHQFLTRGVVMSNATKIQLKHWAEDRSGEVIAVHVVCLVALVVAVTLRCYAQSFVVNPWKYADNWLALVVAVGSMERARNQA
jgi:hypothetical protein